MDEKYLIMIIVIILVLAAFISFIIWFNPLMDNVVKPAARTVINSINSMLNIQKFSPVQDSPYGQNDSEED